MEERYGTTENGRVSGVRKIGVLRANALGDLIFILPALAALRLAYPDAEIVLLATPWHARFLESRPGPVDRVEVVPPSRGVREVKGSSEDESELERFFRAMAAEQFDLVCQLHGGGRYSNPFVRRVGARVTVGLRADDASPLDRCVPYLYYQPEVLRYLEVVSLVGAHAGDLEPRLEVTADDLREAEAVVGERAPVAVLHPGATDPRRRWPLERFAEVGDALARAGATVVLTGTEPERGLLEELSAVMEEDALPLPGRLTVGGLAGLLSRAAVVVSNDTGPLHLAAAVGAATVGIYWCGNMINAGPLSRSRHRPTISWVVQCPVCGEDCTKDRWPGRTAGTRCVHDPSFVEGVPTEEVREYALELLAR